MPHKSLVIYCALAVNLAALGSLIRREYFTPFPSDPTGERAKRLRRKVYAIELVAWAVIGLAQWWK